MGDKKNIIIYIKNGKEFVVKLNFWNQRKVLEDIFKMSSSFYQINDDIEFIYFKNFNFGEFRSIECSKDTICILDNCYFSRYSFCNDINFKTGIYHVINSKLIAGSNIIRCDNTNELLIQSDEKNNGIKIDGIGNKIELKNGVGINKIDLCANDIYLNGEYHLISCLLESDNIKIGSLEKRTLIESVIRFSCYNSNEFFLSNCEIDSDNIYIISDKIYGNQFVLKSLNSIHLNENVYYPSKGQEEVILTDKEFNGLESNLEIRRQLISILKGIYNQKEAWINKRIRKESMILKEIDDKYEMEKKEVKKKVRRLENECYCQKISNIGK